MVENLMILAAMFTGGILVSFGYLIGRKVGYKDGFGDGYFTRHEKE